MNTVSLIKLPVGSMTGSQQKISHTRRLEDAIAETCNVETYGDAIYLANLIGENDMTGLAYVLGVRQ